MKRFFAFLFFIFQLSIFNLLTSCDNPLFIGATGLYKVSFSVNGGSAVDSYRTSEIKEAPFTSRADYTFESWHKKSDFSDSAVSFPLEINEDTMLYAKWYQEFTVSFETNGGDEIESYKTGIIQTEPDTSRTNYIFAGWYTKSDFSGNPVNFPYTVTKPVTLYAKWLATYQVTFETNGGSEVAGYRAYQIQTAPEPVKDDNIFAGWYKDSSFANAVEFPYTLSADTTLYAKWKQKYTVNFETNGGTSVSSYKTIEVESAPVTTRSGYGFVAWYTDSNFTNEATFPYSVEGDTTFYAKWQKIYTVSFVTNGGTAVSAFSALTIQSSPATTKTDSSLEGWYTASDFAEGSKVSFPYTVTGDITLYAKWKAVQCTITYYANGATGGAVPESVSVDKGSSYTILGNTGNLEKTGYAFTKWNTRADGEGQGYSAGSTMTVTGDVSLYAQWGKDYAAMIAVEGGSFYFGDPNSSSERPKITLSSFQIAQYELTYELWLEVYTWATSESNTLGYTLTEASKGYAANDQYTSFVPATNISWNMACVWLNAYSEYKGLEPVYYRGSTVWRVDTNTSGTFSWDKTKNGYRLPTECEWEFAAGGGDSTTHDAYTYSGSNTIGDVAWYSDNSGSEAHPVGTKKANTLGIYDMSGNVAEYCFDYYASYGTGELTNPVHETSTSSSYAYRIMRGGSLYINKSYCEIFERDAEGWISGTCLGMDKRYSGIRVARNAE